MNDKKLTELKQYYLKETLPEENVTALWQELSDKLPGRQYHPYHYTARYAVLTFVLVSLFTGGIFSIQAAQPNTPLYPMRVLTEKAVARVTGQYDPVIENRTEEIINAAQMKSDAEIEQAVKEYEKTLEDMTENRQRSEKANQNLQEKLNESGEKLKTITPPTDKAKDAIEQSIKATEQTQQEVKGENAQEKKPEKQENEHKPENPGSSNSTGENGNNSNHESQNGNNGNGNSKK